MLARPVPHRVVGAISKSPVLSSKENFAPALKNFTPALISILRAEFRNRKIELPARFSSAMSMQAAVSLVETLYLDDILKETSGNVSLSGKIAKIT
jgi:hypothetical protein